MAKTTPKFDIDFRKEYPTLSQNINGVDVELTESEYEATIAEWKANQEQAKVAYEAKAKAEADKAALLARLGLTEDELKTILG
jgi:hypothetical protein